MSERRDASKSSGFWSALLAAASLAGCCEPRAPAQPFAGPIDPLGESPFILVGDLQRTSLLEFFREENDVERAMIVRRIAEERPAFVVMLGDLVSYGSSKATWNDFDDLCAPIREASIPVLAVPGNHEYWLFRGDLDNYFARFPHIDRRSYYEASYGALRLIFLNSNKDQLSEAAWDAQIRWYKDALRRLDADPSVRGALVLLHHPPYTNSTVTGDVDHVKLELVPPFMAAQKTLAMISGHVHNYERFYRRGKAFLVSGGGGGPRAALALGSRRRHPDDLFDGPSVRPFHYLYVKPSPAGLSFDVTALGPLRADDRATFSVMERFELPWAAGPSKTGF